MVNLAQMVDFVVKGPNLHIVLIPSMREDVEALRGKADDDALAEMAEPWLGNGWTWVAPEDIGALTQAPILSQDVEYDDEHGDIVRVGRIYYFDRYQTHSEVEELLAHGEVVFKGMD